jgi:4'-phosphopantetheinyl transferase
LEQVRPMGDALQIGARLFSPDEQACLRHSSADRQAEVFFQYWTRKEAYVKATGEGLSELLPWREVSLRSGEPVRELTREGKPKCSLSWYLHELIPAPGFIGALAVKIPNVRVQQWRLER